ncbi:hypothetical protein KHQ81_15345 (plasmid) [Mycoplasmatota bacterium]|nr:hypothetical protein KHQ81_15345 [Mycoplasmatota bacterium]
MDHEFKIKCINKIQYLITKFQLQLEFKTYIETSSMCKFDMITLGHTKIKDILKYEIEFQNVLGNKTILSHCNGLINITLPKDKQEILPLMNLLQSEFYNQCPGLLKIALGENINGAMIVGNLSLWKHVLIAGETGGGKSICMHCFINSLIYNCDPSDVKMILIDRNRVEFTLYENIKYLLRPVIYELNEAEKTLSWLVTEMKSRYHLFSQNKCRDIESYKKKGNHLPYIVVFIDEFQIITLNSDKAEKNLIELFTQSRKAGIHLVIATQKPTTDVITPLIKANIPTRIAFSVGSHYDSQTILGQPGAEKLNKKGDMILKDEDGYEEYKEPFYQKRKLKEMY